MNAMVAGLAKAKALLDQRSAHHRELAIKSSQQWHDEESASLHTAARFALDEAAEILSAEIRWAEKGGGQWRRSNART